MACIYKAKNAFNQVWELWPLNMNDLFDIKVNTTNMLDPKITYIFHINQKEFTFTNDELIVITNPNPTNQFKPMSPIQAQAYAVDIEKYVEVYERDFFKNSARIDMALVTTEDLDPEKADEIKQRWKSKYNGVFHDVAVLDKGLTPVPLKFTNKDFEFLNLAGWTKEKILGVYRVPESKLGSSNTNRSGAVIADIAFNREAIQPKLILWDEEFNKEVLPTLNPNIEIRHQNPIPRDRELEVKEARVYLGGLPAQSINEFRDKVFNLPAVDGGDTIIIPKGWIKLTDIGKYVDSDLADDGGDSGGDNATDPSRHDGDEPHLNPDGTDDRDDLPTDERSFDDFHTLVLQSRSVWNKHLRSILLGTSNENFEKTTYVAFKYLIEMTTGMLCKYYGELDIIVDKDEWIYPTAKSAAKDFKETIDSNPSCLEDQWSEHIKDQFDQNIRISKIVNAVIKATVNYAKNTVMEKRGIEKEWVICSNECGHQSKLKGFKSMDTFEIGSTKLKFPGQLKGKFNFSCDCTITSRNVKEK
jgi:HK97 family phage portal protein